MKINLVSGAVSNITYTINGAYTINGITYKTSGMPVYYDGTHLWLKPKCGPATFYDAFSDATKAFDQSLNQYINKRLSYAKVNGTEYLYWYNTNGNIEVMSYNIGTKIIQSLQLGSQLQQLDIRNYYQMVVYNGKLLWQPDSGPFQVYDLVTRKFGSLSCNDWSTLTKSSTCYNCHNVRLASDGNKIVVFGRISKDSLFAGDAFTTLTSTASPPVTYSHAAVTDTIALKSAVGQYYVITPSGQYSAYRDITGTGTAIYCKSGNYYPIDDQYTLLAGVPVTITKSSKPDIYSISGDDYSVVPLASIPKCIPSLTLKGSFSMLTNGKGYYYVYSSRVSSKMLLLQRSDSVYSSSVDTYTLGASSVQTTQLTPPAAPSSLANGYQVRYPVSVKSEFDYWFATANSGCYLINSSNSTLTIKVPGNFL